MMMKVTTTDRVDGDIFDREIFSFWYSNMAAMYRHLTAQRLTVTCPAQSIVWFSGQYITYVWHGFSPSTRWNSVVNTFQTSMTLLILGVSGYIHCCLSYHLGKLRGPLTQKLLRTWLNGSHDVKTQLIQQLNPSAYCYID